jgi:hypothetical protein
MYGMVNRAIQDLVCDNFGEDAWERIKTMSGVEVDLFIRNDTYPDEITYKLVCAAARVLGVDSGVVLETFGEHWILSTAREGYGDLLDAAGKTLPEFLQNLPNFHSRVVLIFPKLQPPRFVCTDIAEESLTLHYFSHRPELSSLVVGMVRGLGKMFATEVTADLVVSRKAGADHDEFLVRWAASARPGVRELSTATNAA